VLIAHLSDLHLRDRDELSWLDRQLARIGERGPSHVAVTGDLLDRWDPVLLERTLDVFGAHALLDAERLTLLHGNHDLARGGGNGSMRRSRHAVLASPRRHPGSRPWPAACASPSSIPFPHRGARCRSAGGR
jgi:hypothetical protein